MPSKMFTIHLSKSLPLQQKPALQCHSWILLEQHCIKKSVNTFACINYITIVALKLKILTCHPTPLWDVSPPETTNKFESMWRVIYLTRRNCSFYSCFFTLLVHNITVPPQCHHLSSVHSVRWQLLHSSPLTCASDWKTFISSRLEWLKFCFMPKYINELNIFLYAHFSEHWQDSWLFPTVSGNPGTCWRLYKRKKIYFKNYLCLNNWRKPLNVQVISILRDLNVLFVSEFALLLRPPFPFEEVGDLTDSSSSCTLMVTSSSCSSLCEPFEKPFVFPFFSASSEWEPFSRWSSFPSRAFTLEI